MKKLIRNIATKAFLTENGGWTSELKLAKEFRDERSLQRACLTYHLRNCELYYLFGDTLSEQYDFAIPLVEV